MLQMLDRYLEDSHLREVLVALGEEPTGDRLEMTSRLLTRLKSRDPSLIIESGALNAVTLLTEAMMISGREGEISVLLERLSEEIDIKDEEEEEKDIIEATVAFDDVIEMIAEAKVDWEGSKGEILIQIAEQIGSRHIPVNLEGQQDLVVASRFAVELECGTDIDSVNDLLSRMIWDNFVYGSVIGILHGMEEDMVCELEARFSSLFRDQRSVAILLI